LTKRRTPAEAICPKPAPRKTKRPLGLAKDAFEVPEEFFKPLPVSVVKALRGQRP
jgi:hypothetical protein